MEFLTILFSYEKRYRFTLYFMSFVGLQNAYNSRYIQIQFPWLFRPIQFVYRYIQ